MKTELENMKILRLSNEESNKVTKECLRIAMFKLMGREDFEKISITEISKYAGVSRVAFYRNYSSKEELVEDICRSLFSELTESLKNERFRTNRKAWYTEFFQTIQANSDYFQIYLNANLRLSDGNILESVYPSSTAEEYYRNAAREGAFVSILTDWFRSGMKESPEKMGTICEKLLAPIGREGGL